MTLAQAKEERRRRGRHEEWEKEVFAPIHRSVHAMLGSEVGGGSHASNPHPLPSSEQGITTPSPSSSSPPRQAYRQLRHSKGQRFRAYVEGRGGKRAFLDATTQEELRHPTGLRAPVPPLNRDPTIRTVVKSAEERMMLASAGERGGARAPASRRQTASSQTSGGGTEEGSVASTAGALQQLRNTRALIAARPKSTLDTRVWAAGKIEATPHGCA